MSSTETKLHFPDDGEFFQASNRKSDAIIFFCHFFQGHKKALKRHIQFVNEIGFDAYAFSLNDSPKAHYYVPYSEISHKFGMKHALADQIEMHMNTVLRHFPHRPVVAFAFSNVAGCLIECMARNMSVDQTLNPQLSPNGSQSSMNDKPAWQERIKALVCDSGPGGEFFYSSYKLAEHQMGIKSKLGRLVATPLVAFGWSPSLNKDIIQDLKKLPKDFPVLSIRGWKDKLIAPKHIDAIFDQAPHLRWRKLSLPEAGHLNGLRDFPDDYKPTVEKFLLDHQ